MKLKCMCFLLCMAPSIGWTEMACNFLFDPNSSQQVSQKNKKNGLELTQEQTVIRDYTTQLKMHSSVSIADYNEAGIIFNTISEGYKNEFFLEAFELLPYIQLSNPNYFNKKIFKAINSAFHSADHTTLIRMIAVISDHFHIWSHYFSFENIEMIFSQSPKWKLIFPEDFYELFYPVKSYLKAIEILENKRVRGPRFLNEIRHNGMSETEHFFKLRKFAVISFLNTFAYLAVNPEKSEEIYNELMNSLPDFYYLDSMKNLEYNEKMIKEEYNKAVKYKNHYVLKDAQIASQVLNAVDLNVGQIKFQYEAFALIPYIQVSDPLDFYSYRTQNAVKSILLTQNVEILYQTLPVLFDNFEKWSAYINLEDLIYLKKSPVWYEEKSSRVLMPVYSTIEEIIDISSILHNAHYSKQSLNFLESTLDTVLLDYIGNGQNAYIKRLAVLASLKVYAHLFERYSPLYEKHLYFYHNLMAVLDKMALLWDENSHVCSSMLDVILANDQLFEVFVENKNSAKQLSNIHELIEKIRQNLNKRHIPFVM